MNKVDKAEFVRMTERNDVACADVEVQLAGSDEVLLAEFTSSRDQALILSHIYRKETLADVDWYDNNLHRAFEDVSGELLHNVAGEDGREALAKQILAFGTVKEELREHFQLLRRASLFGTGDADDPPMVH
ncbi:hypothetical protein B5M42_009075 [Paenibacillus athensensis]|uniref:Uncharacterized protein n=1 Tax=Paenibacillus athensensis TaxID=1967502 RepID=A0A4Y8Q9K6_9BACL|nr:hypothetical protein [Paenibacillus athensensis]MCD1258988.1 hypothetical protein [Paenibacillus athensensis]